jgi:hypothetical protein
MYDQGKIEEITLALFGAFQFDNGRIWKNFDFDLLDLLFQQGLITNPHTKAHSVQLTQEGLTKSKEYADHYLKPNSK